LKRNEHTGRYPENLQEDSHHMDEKQLNAHYGYPAIHQSGTIQGKANIYNPNMYECKN
jgi:hypothetical protein